MFGLILLDFQRERNKSDSFLFNCMSSSECQANISSVHCHCWFLLNSPGTNHHSLSSGCSACVSSDELGRRILETSLILISHTELLATNNLTPCWVLFQTTGSDCLKNCHMPMKKYRRSTWGSEDEDFWRSMARIHILISFLCHSSAQ